jgi:alpha-D-xyloside xylohydrolase
VPWAYDEEAVDVVRFFTRLKASLMPYLFRNAIETSKIGVPSMRSMVMEFTEDPACAYLDRQYMLGDSLLVAPIFNEEGIAEYYLPAGRWTDYLTGEVKIGSRYIKEKHDYLSIPLLVKEGSLIAVGAKEDDPVYDYADGVTFKAYELIEKQPASTVVYDMNADLAVKAEVIKKDRQIHINVETSKPYIVVLVNVTDLASVENGSFEVKGKDTVITPNGSGEVVCTLK